jgi:hypothetical protein
MDSGAAVIARSDGRLGLPIATGEPLDHVCPICDGEGDRQGACVCDGLGAITARLARELADDPDPRWAPRPLPPAPEFCGRKCADCAFLPNSLERDGKTAAQLYDQLALANASRVDEESAFYCHQGMHHGARGYVPRQRDDRGVPIGHPICAGWVKVHEQRSQR